LGLLKYLQFFRLHVYPLFNMQNKKKEAAFFCNAASRAKKRPPQDFCGGLATGD